MTPHQLSQVESKLTAAVLKAKAQGLTVSPGGWGDILTPLDDSGVYSTYALNGHVCPMGACLLGASRRTGRFADDAANLLGVTTNQIGEFVLAFDGHPTQHTWPMFQLGQRFRERILKFNGA